MAEQNYGNQKSAVSSETGAHERHTQQQRRSRSPGEAEIVENRRKQQAKNSRPSTGLPVAGGGVWNDARQRLQTLKQDTDDYVRKNPTKAVFTALGIGFVLALMRRR
jgi:ElaB/YqjD/DUF883 family membrane-anchored ribosome-binding protein